MGYPPDAPSVQVILMFYLLVVGSVTKVGAAGTVERKSTAPFPTGDWFELPTELVATILADTLAPVRRLIGDCCSVWTVTVQLVEDNTMAADPSQTELKLPSAP